jgi:hypothetical protein
MTQHNKMISSDQLRSNPSNPRHTRRAHNLLKGDTEMPSPGVEAGTSVTGAVCLNQVPRLKVGTQWGYISYIYPRTARATGSRSTSTNGERVGPKLPRSTTYECVHYHAHHEDLTARTLVAAKRLLKYMSRPLLGEYAWSIQPCK